MSSLPFDPDLVAEAAYAQAHPIGIDGEDADNVLSFPTPPVEGIVPLGYDNGIYHYLSRATGQVHSLSAEAHTKKALLSLASLPHYWQRTKFVTEKGQIQWDEAIDWLMTGCRAAGIYNPDRVRGRGAWLDNGRSILHLGDRLLVNGQLHPLLLPESRALYPAALPLALTTADPLHTAEAHRLCELTNALRWTKPVAGTLLAGWIVCALVCGALRWRPSIWLTGSTGSGKSWAQENIISPMMASVSLNVQSKTTESGLRHRLKSDALPVVFDEFEREDHAAAARVQGVLDLMRQASSESEKVILKGSSNQSGAIAFRIRSSFCFSSINVGLAHAADQSRVTVLSLAAPAKSTPESEHAFLALSRQAADLVTPDYAAGMLARAVMLLAVIRENAETFAVAVARTMGTRRAGDQLGALLAGAYSLHTSRAVTPQEAEAFIARQDWGDVAEMEGMRDEERLLSTIMAHRVRVSLGNGPSIEVSIGRLLSAAFGADDRIGHDTADLELRDLGVRVRSRPPMGVWVSSNHPALAKVLAGSPWGANWARALARLPGAEPSGRNIRFGIGHVGKAVWLPLETLDPAETPT